MRKDILGASWFETPRLRPSGYGGLLTMRVFVICHPATKVSPGFVHIAGGMMDASQPAARRGDTMTTLFAFLHHVAAFTLVAAVAVEFVAIRPPLTLANARTLIGADAVMGVSATVLLVVGLLRVFYFEKGADYYFHSHAFMTKFSVFIAVALLTIIPTREFLSWRKAVRAGQVPAADPAKLRLIRKLLHGELAAIVLILLCAAIMARGGWV
jgi:putative membrane protein